MWNVAIFLSFFAHIVYCYEVTPVASSPRVNDSIGLIWDNCTQSIFYTDYVTTGKQKTIFRYDYNTDKVYGAYIDKCASAVFILPIGDCENPTKQYVVGCDHDGIIVEWDGVSDMAEYKSTLFTVQEDDSTMAMGNSRQSLQGHLYGGTFQPTKICGGTKNATTFKYSTANKVQQISSGLIVTSGWAFDNHTVYHIDSCVEISSFDANCNSDCEVTTVFELNGADRCLLGLEANNQGKLFSCSYKNSSIWEIDPITHTAEAIADLPHDGCSGVAFGGPNMDILFATVSSTIFNTMDPSNIDEYNNSPSLYKITGLGLTGSVYPRVNFN